MPKSTYFLTTGVMVVFMSFCFGGCGTISNFQKNQQNKKKLTHLRKENYALLKTDIADSKLRKGTTTQALKEKYGAPDDLFYSGSSVSSFQVWTYNIYKDKLADNKLDSVILYIENDKLVNWKF